MAHTSAIAHRKNGIKSEHLITSAPHQEVQRQRPLPEPSSDQYLEGEFDGQIHSHSLRGKPGTSKKLFQVQSVVK